MKKGDKFIHRDYGSCTLLVEPDFDGECVVILDNPEKENFTRRTTHASLLKGRVDNRTQLRRSEVSKIEM
jgi:hypothetical protein